LQTHDGQSVLHLETPAGSHDLLVTVRTGALGSDVAQRLAHQRDTLPLLLVAPWVSTPVGRRLAEQGIHYVDAQGNCHLVLGDNYVAHVEGRAAPRTPPTDKGIRAPGYQVLFALLADPRRSGATVRELGTAAGVSRQAVSDMRRRLIAEGALVERGDGYVLDPARASDLLDRWLEGYRSSVRPQLLLGTYRTPDKDPWQLEERVAPILTEHTTRWAWGGTAAGYRLTSHYRGPRTIAHVDAAELPERALRAAPARDGNLILMRAFGSICWEGRTLDTVHPLLAYSEMALDTDERAREAAQELLSTFWQAS
jgi:hypothetical protein